jgi:hypothetical protein
MAEIATWANTNLPVASTSVAGVVKVDGTSVTIAGGVISSASAPPASAAPPLMDGTASAGAATAWSRGDHIHPFDTSRAPLASPAFTGNPTAPTPTTGDNDTSIATTAFVQAQMVASGAGVSTWNTRAGAVVLQQSDIAAVGALHDVGRNLIHNPLFNVAQRGTGAIVGAVGAWTYALDRWRMIPAASPDAITGLAYALADSDRAAIGDEAARYAFSLAVTGGSGATNRVLISQPIEGVRRLAGKTVTLSFWASCSVAGNRIGALLGQSFGTGGSPSAAVNTAPQTVTLSAAFQRFTLTFTLPSISGKTLGTNGDDLTDLDLYLSAGANFAAASGIGVQSGSFYIWGVQLEIGTQATPLEKPDPRYDLANCQRFYQTGAILWGGMITVGATYYASTSLVEAMRAPPTIVGLTDISSANFDARSFGYLSSTPGLGGGVYVTANPTTTGSGALNVTFTASADL